MLFLYTKDAEWRRLYDAINMIVVFYTDELVFVQELLSSFGGAVVLLCG